MKWHFWLLAGILMVLKICVIGTGYVGLVTGTCFSDLGYDVTCVDIDIEKITKLKNGIIPIYEPNLSELIVKNVKDNRLHFSTDLSAVINDVDVCFIAVGTPMAKDGSADLSFVFSVAKEIGSSLSKNMIVVDKSTVPVGTANKVKAIIAEQLESRKMKITVHVTSNPEFLKEGTAVEDFTSPDRVVIGANSEESKQFMINLYSKFVPSEKIICMSTNSAEMTKYAANALLATKISFINEISNICENVGANIRDVRIGMAMDKRIGFEFINPGCGYGGSCFPKDVRALVELSNKKGYETLLLKSVDLVNTQQKKTLGNKVLSIYGENLSNKTFSVWGLAFKPNTDDVRESPALVLIEMLTSRGAKVLCYDPKATDVAKRYYLNNNDKVDYPLDIYSTLNDSSGLIIVTDWDEFLHVDYNRVYSELKDKVLIDGRNMLNRKDMESIGFNYYSIGDGEYE